MIDEGREQPAMEASAHLPFAEVVFTIISTPAHPIPDSQRIIEALQDLGATWQQTEDGTGRVSNLDNLTHIISFTADFPEYDAAIDDFKAVVTPKWAEDSISRAKLCNPRQYSPDPHMFMSGVIVYCADIPEGDKEAIIGGVLALGGMSSGPLSKLTTHIVALTMDSRAVEVALDKRLPCKIVLPHWFDDCLRLGRKIPTKAYELPDPEVLKAGKPLPVRTSFSAIAGALQPTPPSQSPKVSVTDRDLSVFNGKCFFLSEDLPVGILLRATLIDIIEAGGGFVSEQIEEANVLVCQYREGQEYHLISSSSNKHVGNLSWLYHLIAHNTWSSPLRRLLHYPVPRNGIPAFKDLIVSLTNYQGDSRLYLEHLVKATGAKYTKTMKQDTTHLIAAHDKSEKCQAAHEWGVSVVNHIWLEESYAQCKMLPLTNPRYTLFPNRTNLTECIGRTSIDRDAVAKHCDPPKVPLRATSRPTPAAVPASSAQPLSPTRTGENIKEEIIEPMGLIKDDPNVPTAIASKQVKRAVTTTPVARRSTGKENATPPTSGRAAKSKAADKLHDMASDIALYQAEMKRKGGVVRGGRRSGDRLSDQPQHTSEKGAKKRLSDSMREEEEAEADDAEERPTKKKRQSKEHTGSLPPITHRLLLSGDDRWKKDEKKHAADKDKLRALGILETETPADVTIAVVPKILRTKKFVSAIAAGPQVVGIDWLETTLKHKSMADPSEFPLRDTQSEKQYGFNLERALERARKNKKHLLRGWQIFVTEQVRGGFETYRDIIAANGGMANLYKGRTGAMAGRRAVTNADDDEDDEDGTEEPDVLYLVSGSSKAEKAIWSKFEDLAAKEDMVPRIASTDWILHVCMAQEVIWNEKKWGLK